MTAGIPHDTIQDKFNKLTVGITREEAIAAMGTSYTTDGNKLVWACPGHASSCITVEIEDGCVVATATLLAIQWPYAANGFKDGSTGGRVFDPALIMEDVYELPRFQLQFTEEPMAASLLNKTIASILRHAKELEEGKDDNAHASIAYDPLVLPASTSWKLLCKVPRIDTVMALEMQKKQQEEEEERLREAAGGNDVLVSEMSRGERSRAIERGVELLDPLKADCIMYNTEYWTFEYCHNMYVRQFHRNAPDQNGQVLEVEYKLGEYANRKPISAKAGDDGPDGSSELTYTDDSDAVRTTQLSTIGRNRFLTQVWGGGTMCDITRRPRQVEVQFHCDVNGHERIALVEEIVSCQYVVVVNTPRLCADPLFYNTADSTVYDIKCQHVVPDDQYQQVVDSIRRAKEMSERMHNMAIGSNEPAAGADEKRTDGESGAANGGLQPTKDKAATSSKDDAAQPQLVIALNDAKLAELTKGNEDVLQGFLAMVYGDPKLKVEFQQGAQLQDSSKSQKSEKSEEKADLKAIKKKKATQKQHVEF
ncbi:Protein OS-9 [Coemansia sp. RSA 986]|nr:Protein OS-9 [Coemansia sp. RSA 986]